jgi:hypothetical protein
MARNFSCGYSGLLCGSNVTIYQSYLPDGTVIDFADIVPITCTSGQPNYCSGQRTGSGGSFSYSWLSGTPSVASVSGSHTVANVNLLGVSLGTSSISGQVRSQYCLSGGGGPVTTGQTGTLISSDCFHPDNTGHVPYFVGYKVGTAPGSCAYSTQIDTFPPGGSCIQSVSPGGITKNCYQTNVNNCITTTCAADTRTINQACNGFMDLNAEVISKVNCP